MLIVAVRACQAAGATKLSGANAESKSADGIMMNGARTTDATSAQTKLGWALRRSRLRSRDRARCVLRTRLGTRLKHQGKNNARNVTRNLTRAQSQQGRRSPSRDRAAR